MRWRHCNQESISTAAPARLQASVKADPTAAEAALADGVGAAAVVVFCILAISGAGAGAERGATPAPGQTAL